MPPAQMFLPGKVMSIPRGEGVASPVGIASHGVSVEVCQGYPVIYVACTGAGRLQLSYLPDLPRACPWRLLSRGPGGQGCSVTPLPRRDGCYVCRELTVQWSGQRAPRRVPYRRTLEDMAASRLGSQYISAGPRARHFWRSQTPHYGYMNTSHLAPVSAIYEAAFSKFGPHLHS